MVVSLDGGARGVPAPASSGRLTLNRDRRLAGLLLPPASWPASWPANWPASGGAKVSASLCGLALQHLAPRGVGGLEQRVEAQELLVGAAAAARLRLREPRIQAESGGGHPAREDGHPVAVGVRQSSRWRPTRGGDVRQAAMPQEVGARAHDPTELLASLCLEALDVARAARVAKQQRCAGGVWAADCSAPEHAWSRCHAQLVLPQQQLVVQQRHARRRDPVDDGVQRRPRGEGGGRRTVDEHAGPAHASGSARPRLPAHVHEEGRPKRP
mmetsp:Transcript_10433/g.34607  ORF Transcript_10433/g.34607 Transcript_10433/m.34607 type:complete len:270 (-) Transcript_10433:522-1331(-)